jgi:hypothetical protein
MSVLNTLPAFLLLLATFAAYAKGPEPPQRVPLEALGLEQQGEGALAAGSAMSTVQFIDEQHLLVTSVVHRLMKRLPDEPPDDQDRTIEAVIVHLPSGKVLARTHWRVHDGSQYLWNLGHGRFLLRVRDTLSTFVPLANLANHDPFAEQPLLVSKRRLIAVLLSPDRDLLTVETVERLPPGAGPSGDSVFQHTQLNFYRLIQPVQPVDQVLLQAAGVAGANGPVNISLTSAGYIEVSEESHGRWLFDFDPYEGKYVELSPFDTSCRPHPFFVSASEFVAFGCRGGEDRTTIGGFNLNGEQMWQQNFMDSYAFPTFSEAPVVGRFALSRNIVPSGSGITSDFAPSSFTTQEIRVYQMHDGRQLLRVEASPVQRFGGNYDLSQDGMRLAVLHGEAVEIYRLPSLTATDETAVRKAKERVPQDGRAVVNLISHGKPGLAANVETPLQPGAPGLVANPPNPVANVPDAGDTPPTTETRKPPTLYTLPTDKPEERPQ